METMGVAVSRDDWLAVESHILKSLRLRQARQQIEPVATNIPARGNGALVPYNSEETLQLRSHQRLYAPMQYSRMTHEQLVSILCTRDTQLRQAQHRNWHRE
eukprot:4183885-Karenia_brevis.AAC.1